VDHVGGSSSSSINCVKKVKQAVKVAISKLLTKSICSASQNKKTQTKGSSYLCND